MSNSPVHQEKKGFQSTSIFTRQDGYGKTQLSYSIQNGYYDKNEGKAKYTNCYCNLQEAMIIHRLLGKAIDKGLEMQERFNQQLKNQPQQNNMQSQQAQNVNNVFNQQGQNQGANNPWEPPV